MTIRFQITEGDLTNLRKVLAELLDFQIQMKWITFGGSAFTILMAGVFYFLVEQTEKNQYVPGLLLFCGIFGGLFWIWFYKKRQVEKMRILSQPMNSFQTGEGMREVDFTDTEIIVKSSSEEMKIYWNALSDIQNKADYYLFRTGSKGVYIPKKELSNEEINAVNKLIYTHIPPRNNF